MCWDFVGTTIEKVKVSCKLQRIVFNFIITFSTKGVLKWRMFGMYLEIGLHISYISHWNWKETVTYIYWTALFLDHKRPSCMPLTFLIMKISYWIYAANNLGNIYFGIWYIMPTQVGVGVLGNIIWLKYIFVLNIYCQQFGEYMSVWYIFWLDTSCKQLGGWM